MPPMLAMPPIFDEPIPNADAANFPLLPRSPPANAPPARPANPAAPAVAAAAGILLEVVWPGGGGGWPAACPGYVPDCTG